MADIQAGNWDEDFKEDAEGNAVKSEGDSTKTEFIKMDAPGNYKVRLVGDYIKCYKHFKPYRATVQKSEKNLDPAWQAGFYPNERFAINVIDRADGRLKVLEKGRSVFKHFNNYKKIFNKNPTKNEGPDWLITVKIPMLNGKPNKLKTEYIVTHLEAAPFKKEEVDMIKKQGLWPITKIYKSTSAEAMKKMWDELPAEKKIAPKKELKEGAEKPATPARAETGAEPIPESMDNSPADNGSDMFDDASGKQTAETDSANLF
jgi:hypothetical protein